MTEEKKHIKITVVTSADEICPYCGKAVVPRYKDAEYVVSGKGKFRHKQYYHKSCIKNNKKKKVIIVCNNHS